MAILSLNNNKVEVRIKRHAEGTYFDEYVRVNERQKQNARECNQYIVGEAGTRYTVEVILKKGYCLGNCKSISAGLFLCGSQVATKSWYKRKEESVLKEDVQFELSVTNRTWKDENFEDMNVNTFRPQDLGKFRIRVSRCIGSSAISDENSAERASLYKKKTEELKEGLLANKVDEKSYRKRGVAFGIELDGGSIEELVVCRTRTIFEKDSDLKFNFHSRTMEFLEKENIVKYPASLYSYAWYLLKDTERRTALMQLQDLNRKYVYQALEAMTGEAHPLTDVYQYKEADPKEWRCWDTMYKDEKRLVFNKLQKLWQDNERGVVQTEYVSISGEIISLVKKQSSQSATKSGVANRASISTTPVNLNQRRKVEVIDLDEIPDSQPSASTKVRPQAKHEVIDLDAIPDPIPPALATIQPQLKSEPLDLDALPPNWSQRGNTHNPIVGETSKRSFKTEPQTKGESIEFDSPLPKRARNATTSPRPDSQLSTLEMKMEKAKQLARRIQAAEELEQMRREQEALQAEIEAEKSQQ